MKDSYYWACFAAFLVLFIASETGVAIPLLSDHLSNFAATGLVTTIVMGRSSFGDLAPSGVGRAGVVTAGFVAIELLADGPLFLFESDGIRTLGFINTADPADAVFGVLGGGTVVALAVLASRRGVRQRPRRPS